MGKNTFKVFIVDDDKFLLDMYAVKFREQGLDVEVSETGAEALAKLRGGLKPDVLLLDIVMPGVDGFEILDMIRKEKLGGNPALIVLSNQGQETDVSHAKKLGADDYIVKANAVPSEVLAQVIAVAKKRKKADDNK